MYFLLPLHVSYIQSRVLWHTGRWLRTRNPLHVRFTVKPEEMTSKRPNASLRSLSKHEKQVAQKKKQKTKQRKKVSPVIHCLCMCVWERETVCSRWELRGALLSPWGPDSVICLGKAPRPARCVRAGWVCDYVLNKPCDCRHVSRRETRHRHMSLTCWTALSTPHPPRTHAHTHTHTHTHPSSPLGSLLEYNPRL